MNTLINFVVVAFFVINATAYSSIDQTKRNETNILRFQNKQYYFLITTKGNWYWAFQQCRTIDAMPVAINSEEENTAIQTYILNNNWTQAKGYNFWTSGSNLVDGKYYWLSTGKLVHYTKWNAGEPNNDGGNEHFIEVANRGNNQLTWNDKEWVALYYPICEIDEDF